MIGSAPRLIVVVSAAALLASAPAHAYPGGTPNFQTDVAPFCAACHSSLNEDMLAGTGADYAVKQLADNKHLAPIVAGRGKYGELAESERAALVEHIRAVDANSSIALEFPPQVQAGESFSVTVNVTGGAGPVVGVGLVDRAHRWFARPASALGWRVVGAPTVIGPDGQPQSEWIERRPEREGRGITFVNVTGIASDAAAETWANAKVIYSLRAPDKPGEYPLFGVYLYGTEKASPHGFTLNNVGYKVPRGGYGGASGRVRFTPAHTITVKPAAAAE
jgi:cytochrome c553